MQDSDRVLVIGGGIGGLTAAAALKASGVPVEVFERQSELRELGTGVGIQRVAAQALSMLGLSDELREISGPGFEALRMLSWRDGRTLAAVPWHGEVVAVHRGELLEMLARAVGDLSIVHCGVQCVGFRQDASGVTALFADGHAERGAALVGADGLHSVIRAKTIGDRAPRYSGATVWRALPEYEHKDLGRSFAQQVYGPASIFGMFPVDRRLFWWGSQIRPAGAIDPPIGRKQDLLNTFDGWPAEIQQVIEATSEQQIFREDLYDRKPLARWRDGRVTLLGDAAHPTTPTLGQGAGMAIEDGVVLGRELSAVGPLSAPGAVQAGLDSYECKRIPRTSQIVDRSAKLAKLSHVNNPVALFMREQVLSAMPRRFWQLLWEQERTYQIQ
ncbi:MAG TPA: FAD-dependent monooxygenase [Solirubrobacteraceae bacterium]|jgi:prepilin-type processing-associated H-X9-DG protein|nr:FAD-dependent monooxygenase [Solirubrobacteraceae bacterium]